MKKLYFLPDFYLAVIFLAVLLLPAFSSAQEWAKTIVSRDDDSAYSIQQGFLDDSFILAGNLGVIRFHANGNIFWKKDYGADISIIQHTTDGGYIAAGQQNDDFLVLKLASSGDLIWQKTYGSPGRDIASSILQTREGVAISGYLIAGTANAGENNSQFQLIKLDTNGEMEWQKSYDSGNPLGDVLASIQQTDDDANGQKNDGYIVAGLTGSRNGDFWLLKLDANGNTLWKKAYGLSTFVPPDQFNEFTESIPHVKQAADGGFILAGLSVAPLGSPFVWTIKLDVLGNVEWHKDYRSALSISDLIVTADRGYLLMGTRGASSIINTLGDSWIMKLNETGEVLWKNHYGNPEWSRDGTYDSLRSIQQTSDGGYIAAGSTESLGMGSRAMWVLKLDALGNIPDCPTITSGSGVGVDINDPGVIVIDTDVTENDTSATANIATATVADIEVYEGSGCRLVPEKQLIKLSRTGQTISYYPGDDGDLRMGAAWPTTGNSPGGRFHDNGDGTMTDGLTGLMWLKDANCAGTLEVGGAITDGQMDWLSGFAFVDGINEGNHDISSCASYTAAYTDWRMPNIVEIESLVNNGIGDQGVWLEGQGFVNVESIYASIGSYVYYPRYWSSTTIVSHSGMHAWPLWMDDGYTLHHGAASFKNLGLYVWPVRAGQMDIPDQTYPANLWKTGQKDNYADDPGTETVEKRDDGALQRGVYWPLNRFPDKGDGTVLDNLTGLMWLKDTNCLGTRTWQDSLDTIADFNASPASYTCADYDGSASPYNDWHLPNRKELFSLIDVSQDRPSLPEGHPFALDTRLRSFWTSTTYAAAVDNNGDFTSVYAWAFTMERGDMSHVPKASGTRNIWPVRIFDKDNDGISDKWEIDNFGNLTTADEISDFDGDGLLDKDEYTKGTDPKRRDTDNDFCVDGIDPAPLISPATPETPSPDPDGDGFGSDCDNCPDINNLQVDSDGDGAGDACDNCPVVNPDQDDADEDLVGDVCDNCPHTKNGASTSSITCDPDGDGVFSILEAARCDQTDSDEDGLGDACDLCDIETLPEKFSWSNWQGKNWVGGVESQDHCGGCWAFASLGAVAAKFNIENSAAFLSETLFMLQGPLDLSEQTLISDCFWGSSCDGGYASPALDFTRDTGVPNEDCFRFIGTNSACNICRGWETFAWQIDGHRKVLDNLETTKRALVCDGPLVSGIGSGHNVILVGWDDSDNTWVFKNSWGLLWGVQSGATPIGGGYGKIPYGHAWGNNKRYPYGVHTLR